jgi:hypothetical protein
VAVVLNTWYREANPETEAYRWLERIHGPAVSFAKQVFYALYPRIGNRWSLRRAVGCGYMVFFGMWILAAFGVLEATRRITRFEGEFRRLLLLSLMICAVGDLGLVVADIPIYTVAGMAWSTAVLVIWVLTLWFTLRRHGRKALWLLLGAPIVLLPFYSPFLVGL